MAKFIILGFIFSVLSIHGLHGYMDGLKDELLSVGNQLKSRVDAVLKEVETNPKSNSKPLIKLLEDDENSLATLLFLLKQAQSTENIKQIETKLKELQTRIETELDQLNKLPYITTVKPIETTERLPLSSSTARAESPRTSIQTSDNLPSSSSPTLLKTESTGTMETIGTTVSSISTTISLNSCVENQELLANASQLQEKTQKKIQVLSEAHRISEAMSLITDEKRLEQMIDELRIYLKEIDNIKTEFSKLQSKLDKELNTN